MGKQELRAMLDKLPQEKRKEVVARVVRTLNARSAILEKHKHLFEEIEQPVTPAEDQAESAEATTVPPGNLVGPGG